MMLNVTVTQRTAMEMQTGRLVAQRIVDIYENAVAFGDVQCWNWPLVVYTNDWSAEKTVWIGLYPGDVEVKNLVCCESRRDQ